MTRIIRDILALLPGRRTGKAGGRGDMLDRWTLRAALAALALWSACLWVLSGRAFGCCWAGMVEAAAVQLAVAGAILNLPKAALGRVFILARRVLGDRQEPDRDLKLSLARRAQREARLLRRLLAGASLACAVGGLASTAMIWAAPAAMSRLGRMFLLPAWAWALVRLALAAAVMLPLALAAGALILAGSLLRRWGPSDPYRYIHSDLIWAASAGLALAAALWWAGANLLGSALVCSVALMGIALAAAARRSVGAVSARRAKAPRESQWPRAQRWQNLGAWAMPAWLVTLQCRALRDAAGADWAGTWLWVAATVAAMAVMTARLDKRVRVGSAVEAAAATLGALVVAAGELAMFAAALAGGRGAWLWVAAAGAGQLLFSALWAVALSRRRRVFAAQGRAGRLWFADAAVGASLGAGAAVVMLASPAPAAAVAVSFVASGAVVVLAGATTALRGGRRWTARGRGRWAAVGATSIAAVVLLLLGLMRAVRGSLGRQVAIGASLTAAQMPDADVRALPGADAPFAAGALSILGGRLISTHPGRWWLVWAGGPDPAPVLTGRRRGAPDDSGDGSPRAGGAALDPPEGPFMPQWGFADPAFARLPACARRAALADRTGFTRTLAVRMDRFDGIYLGGLRADHPEAWCMYNREALGQCLRRLGSGGLLVVRTACGARGLGELLAVAETFRRVAGGGCAAGVESGDGVALLLVARRGPSRTTDNLLELLAAAAADMPVVVFPLRRLFSLRPGVDPISVSAPSPRRLGERAGWGFLQRLRGDGKNIER